MRYTKAIDIWTLSDEERSKVQIGQWVYAGEPEVKGRFYGQGRSTVVAWYTHGRRIGWKSYCASLRDYGRTVRK